jgi:hypothetical protein
MPITYPAGTQAALANPAGKNPVPLLDIQTLDGAIYLWSGLAGSYPSRITGATQPYSEWIKKWGPFSQSRDMSTDAGEITLQNISGNTIDRDVALALQTHEFDGALAIFRLWHPLLALSLMEWHCYVTEPEPKEDEAVLRLVQLFDPSQYSIADRVVSETCDLIYQSLECGSTGSAVSCDKTFPACIASTRAASERFNGVLYMLPNAGSIIRPTLIGGGDDGGPQDLPPGIIRG